VDLLHAYSKQSGKPDVAAQVASAAAQPRRSPATRSTAKPARRLRGAEIDDLVACYETTRSVNAVARQFRISRQTVAKHLSARGIETVRRMTATDLTAAVEQYGLGDSAATIGRQLGFDTQTVLNRLRAVGTTIRPRNGR
jgi:AraC-like DNA-binding protein